MMPMLHVQKLHDKHAVAFEALPNAIGDRVKFFEMEKDTGRIDDVKLSIQGSRNPLIKECLQGLDS